MGQATECPQLAAPTLLDSDREFNVIRERSCVVQLIDGVDAGIERRLD